MADFVKLDESNPIAQALREIAGEVSDLEVSPEAESLLGDAAALIRALAAVVEGMDPIRALGRPGDWGYGSRLGRAIIAAAQRP